MKTIDILIADDHALFCAGIRDLVQCSGWTVCAEAHNGREAVMQALTMEPTLVIIDVSMPLLNGIEAIRQITSALPDTKVILLTMHHSEELARKALDAGARGYILKSDAGDVLLQAIRSVLTGSIFFTPTLSELVVRSFVDQGTQARSSFMSAATLSGREREILQMLAEGRTTKEVSAILGTSPFTVETQRKSIMRKLQLHTLSDLIRYAIRNRFVEI